MSEGLKHVECHDRGDSLRRSFRLSASNTRRQDGIHQIKSSTLYDILWEARVTNGKKHFIPADQLELAKNRKLAGQSLEDDQVPQDDIPILLDKICSDSPTDNKESFFRIFAILVLCGKAGSICRFIKEGVDDSCLPLPTMERIRGVLKILPHKHGPDFEPERLKRLFGDHKEWNQVMLTTFNTYQWCAIAPFFGRDDQTIPHYILEEDDVLPLTEKKNHIEVVVESLDQDVKEVILGGGFGDVYIVGLHPSHYYFRNQPYSEGSNLFALKCLKSSSKGEFQLEVEALRKYNYSIDKHMIPLLATIQKEEDNVEKYYLLFPKANGDLRHFWKTNFNKSSNESLLRWMAEQCLGIAEALSMLHRDQDKKGSGDDYPIYGRHGDIKAANILWFSNPDSPGPDGWRLVLSDFGLARFHRAISISVQTASKIKKTLTYQAPEFDTIRGKVSRKSDIWAFGCTLLEFTTCYIHGYEAVDQSFPSRRAEEDQNLPGLSEDKFYRTTDNKRSAELKPGVKKWISELHQHPRCTPYLRDLLTFIEHKMFCISLEGRPTATQVAEELKSLLKTIPKGRTP
ncbi:kinase-like protein [Hypoxylon sp. FL1150]|nr:kinase-like protein [Hypoxylon sp. FL1150]